jgi:hypothetical protein
LLKTSIIQVETSDVEVEDDDEDVLGGEDGDEGDDDDDGHDMQTETQNETETETQLQLGETETQRETETETQLHLGEFGSEPATAPPEDDLGKKKKKKKHKISFEEYEAIANAIATHLRSLEGEGDDEEAEPRYMKWSEVVEWYLEQIEQDIGDSVDRLEDMRKKINLVIRRLINVDHILVTVGGQIKTKKDEQRATLAVHPNYVV